MAFLHKMKLAFFAGSLLLLGGCLVDETSTYSSEDRELYYNYRLLTAYWIYQDSLEPYSYYVGKGDGKDYGDVVALYEFVAKYDPFSHYFTPEYYQLAYDYLFTSGGGAMIGIEMKTLSSGDGDTIVVKRVYPNSPAETAGLQEGDKILTANGQDVTGSDVLTRYSTITKGDAGTQVTLQVLRGSETKTYTMAKVKMTLPTVFLDSLDGVPVIEVTEFTETTLDSSGTLGEFRAVLKEIQGAKAAVIDLRQNPGGSVNHCVAMSDDLIRSGVIIRASNHYYDNALGRPAVDTVEEVATAGGLGEETQWVFLADSGSASCSEIMLSAVQTRLQATVIGDTSYGKGVGQLYGETLAGGLAGVTSLQFFDEDWYSYHRIGIIPDEVIMDVDSALARAVAIAQQKSGALTKRSLTVPSVTASTRALSAQLAERRRNVRGPGGAWKWTDTKLKIEN